MAKRAKGTHATGATTRSKKKGANLWGKQKVIDPNDSEKDHMVYGRGGKNDHLNKDCKQPRASVSQAAGPATTAAVCRNKHSKMWVAYSGGSNRITNPRARTFHFTPVYDVLLEGESMRTRIWGKLKFRLLPGTPEDVIVDLNEVANIPTFNKH